MSDQSTNLLEQFFERMKKYDKKEVWNSFEKFLRTPEPLENTLTLDIIGELLKKTEFVTQLIEHVYSNESHKDLEKNVAEFEFHNFVSFAHAIPFMNQPDETKLFNVFDLFLEMYRTTPLYMKEQGYLTTFLEKQLMSFLSLELGWRKLCFDGNLLRFIYIRLTDRLGINKFKDGGFKPQLLFACFSLSVLIAILRKHSFAIGEHFENMEKVDNFEKLLETVLSSFHFRHLTVFLLVGFSLIIKHRSAGNCIAYFDNQFDLSNIEQLQSDNFKRNFDTPYKFPEPFKCDDQDERESFKRKFLIHTAEILSQGFAAGGTGPSFKLIHPINNLDTALIQFQEIVEEPVVKKRKLDPSKILTFKSVGLPKPAFFLQMELEDWHASALKCKPDLQILREEYSRRQKEVRDAIERNMRLPIVEHTEEQKRVMQWARQVYKMEEKDRPVCYADPNYVPPASAQSSDFEDSDSEPI